MMVLHEYISVKKTGEHLLKLISFENIKYPFLKGEKKIR